MILIALGHRSRTGKDTIAKHLKRIIKQNQRLKSVEICGFADTLKQYCYKEYKTRPPEDYETNPEYRTEPIEGYNNVVELWCKVGDGFRMVYPDYWVDKLFENVKSDIIIIKDLRYLNELETIKNKNGMCFKINRNVPHFDTPADNALKDFNQWDGEYDNLNNEDPFFIAQHIYKRVQWTT